MAEPATDRQLLEPPTGVERIPGDRVQAVRPGFPELAERLASVQPCFAVIRDGSAVSVGYSSYTGTRAAEAGVDMLPEYRGHGFAVDVMRA